MTSISVTISVIVVHHYIYNLISVIFNKKILPYVHMFLPLQVHKTDCRLYVLKSNL